MSAPIEEPGPPRPVRRAVTLMAVGAVVQALSTLATALDRAGTKEQTARLAREFQHRTLSGAELERATDQAHWFAVGTGVAFVAVWVAVALACRRGFAWGRAAATVLTIVYTFTFVLSGVRSFGPGALVGLATAAIGLSVVYLLWRRPVTPWLSSQARARGRVVDAPETEDR